MSRGIRPVPLTIGAAALLSALVLHAMSAEQPGSPFSPDGKPSKSPSDALRPAPPAGNHGNPGSAKDDVVLVKSPFTPPPHAGSARPDQNFRPRHSVPPRPRRPQEARSRAGGQRSSTSRAPAEEGRSRKPSRDVTSGPRRSTTRAAKPVGSPFRPPVQTEWRGGQRSNPPPRPLQEPALPENIRPSPPSKRKGNNPGKSPRRVTGQGSPYVTRSQERDMHESAPGVTPWTRYTPRPKVRGQEEPNDAHTGRCGSQSYSPRSQICCQGSVKRRQGMKPSCCGKQSFDSAYSKCCSGVVSLRTSQQPDCP